MTRHGPSSASRTGPVASFEVPTRSTGDSATPSMGQRSPSLVPATGPNGISDTRVPVGRSSASRGGAAKTTSAAPITRQGGPDLRQSVDITASA